MTPREKEIIRQWAGRMGGHVDIRLRPTSDDRSAALETFCNELQKLAPIVRVKKQDHNDPLPGFRIADNIGYRAVPVEPELSPFLDFLEGVEDEAVLAGLPEPDILDRVRVPADLTVFITPHCPVCPQAVASVLALARRCPKIQVTVVDGVLFPELADAANVRSAPTVILEDRFRWVGAVDLREIVRMIESRDPSQLGVQSLQQMIEAGNAEALADMMAESDAPFPAFIDLLTHAKWPVRLGAMVSFEFLNEARRDLSFQILETLWDRFETSGNEVKGDILYLLGESKQPEMMERLKAVHTGDYPETVREAAGDALKALESLES
ncbi:MAG: thioredoxin family protein [Desulfosalsimonadaceae bacterium]|nr:thioredoxin family protein [Desulfosalsimonadaceae bacterium]